MHPGGRYLLSADYGSGTVAVHRIEESGAVGERTALVTHSEPAPGPGQQGPHAHQFVTAPDGGHVLAVDLGTDTVYTYRLDERAGTLTEVARASARPGAGPRHLTFHPGGRFAYLANELDNTVTVCAYEPGSGRLRIGEAQPTGTGSGTSYPAQFVVTGDGRYAYLANRGTTASRGTPSRRTGQGCGCWTPCPWAVTSLGTSPSPRRRAAVRGEPEVGRRHRVPRGRRQRRTAACR